MHQARSGAPGVAYLEIPQDVFGASAAPVERPWPAGHDPAARSLPVPGDLDRAIALLSSASRPVALAGSGAFFSGAADALRRFVERTGIPVTTTSAARGLIDEGARSPTGAVAQLRAGVERLAVAEPLHLCAARCRALVGRLDTAERRARRR